MPLPQQLCANGVEQEAYWHTGVQAAAGCYVGVAMAMATTKAIAAAF